MSLGIKIDLVRCVLLADGWHWVRPGSFDIDAYEFLDGEVTTLEGGECQVVASMGFRFEEPDEMEKERFEVVIGPLTSILAVKYRLSDG